MNISQDVEAWMEAYDNPQKPLVAEIRKIILAADSRIQETIKWQAPTFFYNGNLASFFPKSKQHASLMFHKGATIEGTFPSLEGDAKEARTLKIADIQDLRLKTTELQALVVAWCDQHEK